MLGIPDLGIFLAFILSILSAIACIVYGMINWNKGAENEAEQVMEELVWQEKENEIDDKL